MCVDLWCLTAVFASASADAKTDGKCHRGQARRARQEPDAPRFEREIRVFPAQVHAYIKNHQRPNVEARVRRVCGICGAQRNKSHCLAAVTRSGPVCPPSEDLEDLEQSGKAFKSGEEEAGSIKLIGRADTLPTEGFYD